MRRKTEELLHLGDGEKLDKQMQCGSLDWILGQKGKTIEKKLAYGLDNSSVPK